MEAQVGLKLLCATGFQHSYYFASQHLEPCSNMHQSGRLSSRGFSSQDLLNFDLWWWNGPPWLQTEPIQWPPQPVPSPLGTSELKANVCLATLTTPEWIEGNFSSYNRLLRVNAWILHFISNLKLVSELHTSELHLFSLAQNRHFHDECCRLSRQTSQVSFSPYLSQSIPWGRWSAHGGQRLSNSSFIIRSETSPHPS